MDRPELPDNPTQDQLDEYERLMNQYEQNMDGFMNDIQNAIDDLFNRMLAPAFFLISAGLVTARAGGSQLWTSTRVAHQYMPATIILENPSMGTPPVMASPAAPQGNPCPSCGRPMEFVQEYDRYYCYSCQDYEPKGVVEAAPAKDTKKCKHCGGELEFIKEYDKSYCYSCEKYDS